MFSVVFVLFLFFVYPGYPLMDVWMAKDFAHSVGCLLTQVMVSCDVQRLLPFPTSLSLIAGLNASSVRFLVKKFFPVPVGWSKCILLCRLMGVIIHVETLPSPTCSSLVWPACLLKTLSFLQCVLVVVGVWAPVWVLLQLHQSVSPWLCLAMFLMSQLFQVFCCWTFYCFCFSVLHIQLGKKTFVNRSSL